jgi:hypothetical protein
MALEGAAKGKKKQRVGVVGLVAGSEALLLL